MERFEGLISVQGKVKDGVKKADAMIDALVQKIEAAGGEASKVTSASTVAFDESDDSNSNFVVKFLKNWYKGALSGVSHIIPLVIIGGLCVGLLNLFMVMTIPTFTTSQVNRLLIKNSWVTLQPHTKALFTIYTTLH